MQHLNRCLPPPPEHTCRRSRVVLPVIYSTILSIHRLTSYTTLCALPLVAFSIQGARLMPTSKTGHHAQRHRDAGSGAAGRYALPLPATLPQAYLAAGALLCRISAGRAWR